MLTSGFNVVVDWLVVSKYILSREKVFFFSQLYTILICVGGWSGVSVCLCSRRLCSGVVNQLRSPELENPVPDCILIKGI